MQKTSFESGSTVNQIPVLFVNTRAPLAEEAHAQSLAGASEILISEFCDTPTGSSFLDAQFEAAPNGWRTYNFEVAEHHTYIADGVRVHNTSGLLGRIGNDIDGAIDQLFGGTDGDGTFRDAVTDLVTSPLHAAGNIINGVAQAGVAIVDGFTSAAQRLVQGDIVGAIVDAGGGIVNAIGAVVTGVVNAVGSVFGAVVNVIGAIGNAIGDLVNAVFGGNADDDGNDNSNIGNWFSDRDNDGVPNLFDFNDGVGWLDTADRDDDDDDTGKPIIIDLDGDGIEIDVNGSVSFDMDADGFREQTAWVAADDAFLVIDLNEDGTRGAGDGKINHTRELILSEWMGGSDIATDLQALAMFDAQASFGGNNDGVLDSGDTIWQELRIWQDANQNGEADDGELRTLDQLGMTQINLTYDDGTDYADVSNDVTIFGSTLLGSASYNHDGSVLTHGEALDADGNPLPEGTPLDQAAEVIVTGGVGDVALSHEGLGWRRVETATGYSMEFEDGNMLRYAEIEAGDSAELNLADAWVDGAEGDDRNNRLDASGHTRAVSISGGEGADVIYGGALDDMLSGDQGADHLLGLGGNDLIFFDEFDTIVLGGDGQDTAIFTGTTAINFDLVAQEFEIAYGGDGDDALTASYTATAVSLYGGAGNDTLAGSQTDDVMSGDEGADDLRSGTGGDLVLGGEGDDTLLSQDGDDYVRGGNGADSVDGGNGDDVVFGDAGNDSIWGGYGDDYLSGGDGDDLVRGWLGDDTVSGGAGDDRVEGNQGDDLVQGGAGDDTLTGNTGDDILEGGAGNDRIFDQWGDNLIRGGEGDDTIYSNAYDNQVQRIHGGIGTDTLVLNGSEDLWNITYVEYDTETLEFVGQETGLGDGETQFAGQESGVVDVEIQNVGTNVEGVYQENNGWVDVYGNAFSGGILGTGQYLVWSGNTYLHVQDVEQIHFTGQGHELHWSHLDTQTEQEFSLALIASRNGLADTFGTDWEGGRQWWLSHGQGEHQPINFNALLYLAEYQDIYNTHGLDYVAAAEHYITNGRHEGRALGDFDALQYLRNYADVRAFAGTDLSQAVVHFLQSGRAAGLTDATVPSALSDMEWTEYLATEAGSLTTLALTYADPTQDNEDVFFWANHTQASDPNAVIWGWDVNADDIQGGSGHDVINADVRMHFWTVYDNGGSAGQNDSVQGGSGSDSIFGNIGDDTLQGNNGSDSLVGDGGVDHLTGNAGSDQIFGGAGDDVLNGEDGADYIEGGSGSDEINGGAGSDGLRGGDGDDTMSGGDGSDALTGGAGADQMQGDAGDDTLQAGDGADTLLGGEGDDALDGEVGNDSLEGGLGNDVLVGGEGNDTLMAGAGHDIVQGDAGADLAFGGDGFDRLEGGLGDDTLHGQGNDDLVVGGAGNDSLTGGTGNDILNGGEGSDTLSGGSGVDALSYADAAAGVYLRIDNADAANFTGEAMGDVFVEIENAYGSNHNDEIFGSSGHNVLWGADGQDTLIGRDGNDDLVGGDGNDILYGETGIDRLDGGDGDDILFGGTLGDQLIGGDGIDRAQYSAATTAVTVDLQNEQNNTGEAAGDTFDSIENLHGGVHNDILRGDSSANTVWGGGGDDTTAGRDGDDVLHGQTGNDVLHGDVGDDTLHGGNGDDILVGGLGADRLVGGDGTDRIQYHNASAGVLVDLQNAQYNSGEAAGDTFDGIENLHGGDHNDTLRGDNSANTVWGGGGNDTISGRAGNDVLVGQSGSDTFIFQTGWDQDKVHDFVDGEDQVFFENMGFSTATDALAFATQVGSSVVFDFGSGDKLTVANTTLAQISDDILVS